MRPLALLLPLTLLLAACPKSNGAAPSGAAPASQPAPAAEPPPAAPALQAAGQACMASEECAAGLRCTTESGACERPPGCGPDDVCPAVCYGVCAQAQAATPPPAAGDACREDADCVTFSNYCGGCRCDALVRNTKPEKCPTRPVNCLVDPCMGKGARCQAGQCVVGAPEE